MIFLLRDLQVLRLTDVLWHYRLLLCYQLSQITDIGLYNQMLHPKPHHHDHVMYLCTVLKGNITIHCQDLISVCACVCACMCVYVRECVCVCVCMTQTHTHTHLKSVMTQLKYISKFRHSAHI